MTVASLSKDTIWNLPPSVKYFIRQDIIGSAPSTICKNISVPSLQLMRPAYGIQHRLSGFQSKVVGIIQTELASRLSELVVRQALQRRLCRHGHEDREGDIAMGEAEGTGTCFCCLGIDSSQHTSRLSTGLE